MKLYIAGPMSGIPSFNYPAFLAAGKLLQEKGYIVINPAEMDSPDLQALCLASKTGDFTDLGKAEQTWGDLLSGDVKLVADVVDGVALLPGWENSRGARLEAYVALSVQKPVFLIHKDQVNESDPTVLMAKIMVGTLDQGDVSRYEEANNG